MEILFSWYSVTQFKDPFKFHLNPQSDDASVGYSALLESTPGLVNSSSIVQLELSMMLKLLVVLHSNGHIALCSIGKKGLRQADLIKVEKWINVSDAVCCAIACGQQFLAVGCKRGVVDLYDLAEDATHLRTLSLNDWG